MDRSPIILEVLCGLLFCASLLLFLITAAWRRRIDATLKAAAVAKGIAPDTPQLPLFGEWQPDSRVILAQPERRWTYDQDYMIAFIEALDGPIAGRHEASRLGFYSNKVLRLDIAFAALFALFIVCAAVLLARWCEAWPWVARIWIWSGCMGVLYGVADVAEDVKLRGILHHAKRMAAMQVADTMSADAAQIDASNTLTRVKLMTNLLSGTGAAAFGLFLIADKIVSKLSAPSSGHPNSGATAGDRGGGPSLDTSATA